MNLETALWVFGVVVTTGGVASIGTVVKFLLMLTALKTQLDRVLENHSDIKKVIEDNTAAMNKIAALIEAKL